MEKLLDYFKPERYDLSLNINKHTEKVFATTIITGVQQKDQIKLHAKNLKITSLKVDDNATGYQQEGDILTIKHEKIKRAIKIEIKYTFVLNRNMEGAYLSTYEYEGKEQRIVTTQFESHYARECFPCVDEPAAKAIFKLKIITADIEDTVISNMPVETERILQYETVDENLELGRIKEQKIVTFEETPKMSTYLLAFCLGEFRSKTTETVSGIKITSYCALNQKASDLDYPNQIAAEALNYYDSLFGVPYPLPKLDQVAIPDFEAGAMENWGLVTYREACFLAGKSTPQPVKEYISTVIAHELSHQWFGNLVTMYWWDNLWLNESFATVMQYMCIDDIHPEYNIWQDFFTGDCYAALKRDALPGVQAVQQPVNDPAEIATLFDGAIVYAKGAHLIFMLMRLMGKKQFFSGIRSYFKTHRYGNTVADDLWAALQSANTKHFDVKEVMDAWISQPGYPVITDENQQRFLLTGATDDTKWPLPQIMDDMSGHYLINLSGPEFEEKIKQFDTLAHEQKLRLLIDREMLSRTVLVSSASLMELLSKFDGEENEPIWCIVSTALNGLKLFAPRGSKYFPEYQSFVFSIIKTQLKRLGFRPRKGESANDAKLRPLILGYVVYCEEEKSLARLARLYKEDLRRLPPDTRGDIIDAHFKVTEEADFDKFLELYRTTADPDLKDTFLDTITSARKPAHTKRLLELLEQPEIVKPQDHIYLFAYLLQNNETRQDTYKWFYWHWDYIKEITGDKSLDDYLRVAAARVMTEEEADKFFEFADALSSEPAFTRTVAVAHQDVAARLRWLHDDRKAVEARLEKVKPLKKQ